MLAILIELLLSDTDLSIALSFHDVNSMLPGDFSVHHCMEPRVGVASGLAPSSPEHLFTTQHEVTNGYESLKLIGCNIVISLPSLCPSKLSRNLQKQNLLSELKVEGQQGPKQQGIFGEHTCSIPTKDTVFKLDSRSCFGPSSSSPGKITHF